jgi:hypothetical protein
METPNTARLKVRDIAPLWTIRMVKTNNTTGLDD